MSEEQAWLLPGLPQGEQVVIPSGGEDFLPTGFIGQWTALPTKRGWASGASEEDVRDIGKNKSVVYVRGTPSGAFVYFSTKPDAEAGMKEVMEKYGMEWTQMFWLFQAQKDRLFWYSDEAKDKWSDLITGDVRIASLAARKNLYGFHLIALPSAVAAVARYFGKDLQFDINALLERDVQDDDFFERMCGHPDAKKKDVKAFQKDIDDQIANGVPFDAALTSARSTLDTPMEFSVLWRQREVLWKELGEPDAHKYTVGQGNDKTDTTATYLSGALGIVQPWTEEARWVRVMLVPDPKPDQISDEGRRYTIPVIVDYYHDEAEAKAAFEATRAQGESEGSSEPSLPGAWAGLERQAFVDAIKGLWGQPESILVAKLGCSVEEAQEWGAHLGLP